MQISFSFQSGHKSVSETMGFATEDPLVFKEESRPHILKEIKECQMTYSPNYIIEIKPHDIKCVYFCFPNQQLSLSQILEKSFKGEYWNFECTILIKMNVPGEVLKFYGPACNNSKFFENDCPNFVRSIFKMESKDEQDMSKSLMNFWNLGQVYAVSGITSHDIILEF